MQIERKLWTWLLKMQMYMGIPSFENPMYRPDHIQEKRHQILRNMARGKVLEIGSLMGSSAIAMAQEGCEVWCVDPWLTPQTFKIFLHNVDVMGVNRRIHPIRAFSAEALPLFADQSFDTVYIDGSHLFEDVKFDITQALRLVKPGGLILGDDFELPYTEVDRESCVFGLHENRLIDPKLMLVYHPGVTYAVYLRFGGDVKHDSGIWWVDVPAYD